MVTSKAISEDRRLWQSPNCRECAKCLLNCNDVPSLQFNSQGICDVCQRFEKRWRNYVAQKNVHAQQLNDKIEKIKFNGRSKKYDCIIGVSGGVDSTFLAWKICSLGLRPLAVHFDNGWNSELAVHNIEKLISTLGLDLHTHVVNWEEFRDLQRAYIKSSVVDIEVPTDHGIYGTLFQAAIENDIQFVLGGNNIATEGFSPRYWHYHKWDHVNLLDIHRQFGTCKLQTYPLFGRRQKKRVCKKRIEIVEILNLIQYSRNEAVNVITSQLGWCDYGIKHGESIFTKFYQEYLLPKKFNIDKRKAHLSTLIHTGEISRSEAVEQYCASMISEAELERTKEYVLKKLGFTEGEFQAVLQTARVSHEAFETEGSLFYEYRFMLPFRNLWNSFRERMGIKVRGKSYALEIR